MIWIVINVVCLLSVAAVSMVRSSQIVPNVLPGGQSAFEKHEIILVFDIALVEATADSLAHEAIE